MSLQKLYRRWFEGEPAVGHIEFSRNASERKPEPQSAFLLPFQIDLFRTWSLELKRWVKGETEYWTRSGPNSMAHRHVRRHALVSRLILLLVQVIGQFVLPQHENDGFKTPRPDLLHENGTLSDQFVNFVFGGFASWDGQYFLHVSTQGYTHENTMAFFPLFPMMAGTLAQGGSYFLSRLLSLQSLSLLVGWLVNTWCFRSAAVSLYDTVRFTDRGLEHLAMTVVYLFCYNPASVFFSAFYSESLFAWLTFTSLLSLYQGRTVRAAYFAGLGSLCRSNGLLNFGFIAAFMLKPILCLGMERLGYLKSALRVAKLGVLCTIGLVPFLLFQYYCFWKLCGGPDSDPGKIPKLCHYQGMPYTSIQGSNWDVGFLKYFQMKQLPNFILAAPVLYTLGYESYTKLMSYYKAQRLSGSRWVYFQYLPELAFVLHGLFLTLFCFFFIHVQVSTRMILSACPYLYIWIARRVRVEASRFREREIYWMPYSVAIQIWFGSYFLIGTLAFSLGYPWT